MSNIIAIERNAIIIASEIISIKNQTKKIMLMNSIEIGKRLVEAKMLIGHGNWGGWLENTVDYSQRTANNLMKIYEEYGTNMIAENSGDSNSQSIANLSYTKAVALLGLSSEEREEVLEENKIEDLSVKEVNKLIREKKTLEDKLSKNSEDLKADAKKIKKLEKENKLLCENTEANGQNVTELTTKVRSLEDELESTCEELKDALANQTGESSENLEKDVKGYKEKIKELEDKLKAKPKTVKVEKEVVPDETLEKAESDEDRLKYSEAVKKLIGKMGENL